MNLSQPKPQEGASLWLIKIFTGMAVIIVLGIHLVVNHLVAPNGLLSYADVIAYYKNPIIPAMEILFLVIVVSHSLLGLRSILLDLQPSQIILKWVDRAMLGIGTTAIIYGTWLALKIASS